jgi:hypothetical protein
MLPTISRMKQALISAAAFDDKIEANRVFA